MNNSDLPAMPQAVVDKEYWNEFMAGVLGGAPTGLSKREHFAGLAMQSMLARVDVLGDTAYQDVAAQSLYMADALLLELDK